MLVTDTAEHYIQKLETTDSAEPQIISRLLDSLAHKTHLSGDLGLLELAIERAVSDSKYGDELGVARALKNIKQLRRINAAHLSQQAPRTIRRGPDMCGND